MNKDLSNPFEVTMDLVRYINFDHSTALYVIYVHQMDRYLMSIFRLYSPNLHFMRLKYCQNMKILFRAELRYNELIVFDKKIDECIITNMYSNDLKIIATCIGFFEYEGFIYFKVKANDFVFYFSDYFEYFKKYIKIGTQFFAVFDAEFEFLEDFEAKVQQDWNELVDENLDIHRDWVDWPTEAKFWPDPEFKVGKGESPLEKLILSDPDYVRQKLGREDCDYYPIKFDISLDKFEFIKQKDKEMIEGWIKKYDGKIYKK